MDFFIIFILLLVLFVLIYPIYLIIQFLRYGIKAFQKYLEDDEDFSEE